MISTNAGSASMLNNMNWIIGITLAIATKQQLTIEIRQRKIILQARNQTGIGDEEAPERNHIGITLGQYFSARCLSNFSAPTSSATAVTTS